MADMSEMLKNFASMMEGKDIPDNIKEMLNSLQNSSSEKMTNNSKSDNNNNSSVNYNNNVNNDNLNSSNTQNSSQGIPNIDINTMLKIQKIMSAMNSSSNNSGANLLRSLKPYLKPSRQAKVDEYIQLLSMEKVIELMKLSGGDGKNDT